MKTKRRILFINHTGQMGGGESVFVDAIRVACSDSCNEIYVVYPVDGDNHFKEALKGIGVKKIKGLPYRVLRNTMALSIRNFSFSLLAISYLICFCLKHQVDIIWSNTSVNVIGVIIAKILNKKHIWYIHELSTSYHRWTPRLLDKMYHSFFLYHHNYNIFVSKATKDAWLKQVGCEIVRSEVLYSPYKKVKVSNCSSRPFTFGFLGGLTPNKNIATLMDAFSHIAGARLIIGGSGQMLEKLQKKAKEIRCEQYIEFWGQVDDLSKFYSSIDVLVQVSLNESWGLVALEAIHAKKVVIMTNHTGLREILKPEEGVVYVDPTDTIRIAREMSNLMNNTEYRNDVVDKGMTILSRLDLNNNFNNRITSILNEA